MSGKIPFKNQIPSKGLLMENGVHRTRLGVRIPAFLNGLRRVDRKLGQVEAVYVTDIHRLMQLS